MQLSRDEKIQAIGCHVESIMQLLEIRKDESTSKTPYRVAKMYVDELFKGLDESNFPVMNSTPNDMGYDHMLIVKDIKVNSVCEHHLVPFIGVCHVAYIPDDRIMGLSKFNRLVDYFSRRPQVQERLTHQIHNSLVQELKTEDVAVLIKATHHCVKIRGVMDQNSETITSKLTGHFKDRSTGAREEFLDLCRG